MESEISKPSPLNIAVETKQSKLAAAVFSDDRARCCAISVFMSRSIKASRCSDKRRRFFRDDFRNRKSYVRGRFDCPRNQSPPTNAGPSLPEIL
jgi:hypothetical protein